MIRGVRENKNNKDNRLQRSRSKSPGNNKNNDKNKNKQIAKSNKKLNRSRSKSPERSPNNKNKGGKQNLQKSKSQKKLNKSLSRSKIEEVKNINKNGSKLVKSPQKSHTIGKMASQSNNNNQSILMKSARKQSQQSTPKNINKSIILNSNSPKHPSSKNQKQPITPPPNTIKSQQKQMGLIFLKPQHDKILFKPLQPTDQVFQKYHDMISNDNDTNYVTNALPQLISMKKQDDSAGRDFVSGKIARLSGVFDNLTVDKILSASRKLPHYYTGQSGKNLYTMKIVLVTKFKVEVDLGFLLYSVDGDKLTIFRIYVSKIYRKMNYLGFIYLEVFRMLVSKHSGCDRWSMFILEKNVLVHKFFKYLGFKIQKIATETKNKTVDYFQEFTMKRKQLNTVLASMK